MSGVVSGATINTGTAPAVPTIPAPTPLETVLRAAVADAPTVIQEVEAVLPGVQPKALLASRTPWGTILVTAIGWAVAKYGLGWDSNVVDMVAGGFVLLGSYAMRYVTSAPIKGLLKTV